jgi:hypothetical protein
LGGLFVTVTCVVLFGALGGWLASGSPFETKIILFLVVWAGVTGVTVAGAAGLVIALRSLRLVGIEVRAGPTVVLHVLPFRGPARVETQAGTEVSAVVKVVNRKGLCRQVWLRWSDGRKLLLDRVAGEMAGAALKKADAPHALPELARLLHERLKVPMQVERRRFTLF